MLVNRNIQKSLTNHGRKKEEKSVREYREKVFKK